MLTTNDAYLYRFEVKITSLDLRFRPDKPISVMWHKEDKLAETQKSSNFASKTVTFRQSALVLNLRLMKNQYDLFRTKSTYFTVFQHDLVRKQEIGTTKFKVSDIFEKRLNAYALPILNKEIIKGYLNFTISEKFVTKASEFKFNKQPSIDESQFSSVQQYEIFETTQQIPMGQRKLSHDFNETKSMRYQTDEVSSVYNSKRRLKTERDRLIVRPKQMQAKSMRSQKVVWWQFRQVTDFYNKKLSISRKVYEDSIQQIVFQTNQVKDKMNLMIEELSYRIQKYKENQQHLISDLQLANQSLERVKEQFESANLNHREELQLEKTQYLNKSSGLVQLYQSKIKDLYITNEQNIKTMSIQQQEINYKEKEIAKLNSLKDQLATNNRIATELINNELIQVNKKLKIKESSCQQLQKQILSITSALGNDLFDLKISQNTPEQKIRILLQKYNEKTQKIKDLTNTLSRNSALKTDEQVQFLRSKIQEKDKIISQLKVRDQMGQKSLQSLESLLGYQKQSSSLFSSRLQKQVNESELLRRHLRMKQLQLVQKDKALQQLNSKFMVLQDDFILLKTQNQNKDEEVIHLQETIKDLDGIVKSRPIRGTTALVDQLHEQIKNKNHSIQQLQRRNNRFMNILAQYKDSGVAIDVVVDLILGADFCEIDSILGDSGVFKNEMQIQRSRTVSNDSLNREIQYKNSSSSLTCKQWQQSFEVTLKNLLKFLKKVNLQKQQINILSLQIDNDDIRQRLLNLNCTKQLELICKDIQVIKGKGINFMAELEKNNIRIEQQNNDLKRQIMEMNQEVQRLLEGQKSFRKNTRQANQRERQHSQALNNLNSELEKNKEKLKKTETELQQMTMRLQKLQQFNKSIDHHHSGEILERQRNTQKKNNQINDLKKNLEILQQKSYYLQHDLNNAGHNFTDLNNRFIELENQHVRLTTKSKSLQDELLAEKQQNKKLKEKFYLRESTLESEVADLRSSLSKTKVEASLLLQAKESMAHANYKQVQTLKMTILQRQQELKLQYKSLQDYKFAQIEDNRKRRALQSKVKQMISSQQDLMESCRVKLLAGTRELSRIVEQKQGLEQQLKLIKKKYSQQCQRVLSIQNQQYSVEEKYTQMKRTHQISSRQLRVKQGQIQSLEEEIRVLKSNLQSRKNQISELGQKIIAKQEQTEQFLKVISAKKQIINNVQKQIQYSQRQFQEQMKQHSKEKQDHGKFINTLQKQLQNVQQKNQSQDKQIIERDLYIQELKKAIGLQAKSHQKQLDDISIQFQIREKGYQDQISQNTTKQIQLAKQIELNGGELRRLQKQNRTYKEDLSKMQLEAETYFRENCQYITEIREQKDIQRYFRTDLQNSQRAIEAYKRRQVQLLEDINKLKKKQLQMKLILQQHNITYEQCKKERNASDKRMRQVQKMLEQIQAQLKLKQKIHNNAISQKSLEHQTELKKMDSDFSSYKFSHRFTDIQYNTIQQNYKRIEIENSRLKQKLSKLQSQYLIKLNQFTDNYTKKGQQKDNIISLEVSEMSSQIQGLKKQVQKYQKQTNILLEHKLSLTNQNKQLRDQFKLQNDKLSEVSEKMQSTSKKEAENIRCLNAQLQKSRHQLLQFSKKIQTQFSEIAEQKQYIKQLQFELYSSADSDRKNQRAQLNKLSSSPKQKKNTLVSDQAWRERLVVLQQRHRRQMMDLKEQLLRKQNEATHYIETQKQNEEYIRSLQEAIQRASGRRQTELKLKSLEGRRFQKASSQLQY